jgi:hypothetical protein
MSFSKLPIEIVSKILLYLQSPVAKLIKDEIEIYEEDHHWEYTKMYKMYYIKNIMPFYCYYFDKRDDPYDYDSYHREKMIKELYEQCR